jgi:glycosyltransferase involved in cell wall biosynthesis
MNFKNELVIFIPSIEDGGVEKNLYLISNYLSKKVQNISLITASKNKIKKFEKKINYISPKTTFWNNKNRRYKTLICLFILIKKIISNKNILLFSFQANIYALIIANLFKIKIIVRSNTAPAGWNKNFFKKIIFRFFYQKANLVIVNSKYFQKQMKNQLNINSECIYNPLDTHLIKVRSQKKIKFNFFKRNTLNLINIGRLTDQKDQITILKAINLIKNSIKLKLLIIGKGSELYNLNKYIINHDLKKIVKCIGYKSNPYPYVKKSDIFILSSLYEGLPNVLLEAMFLKKFIISTNCPTGPYEILNNNKYGKLIPIKDYRALSKTILDYKSYYKNKKILNSAFHSLERFDFKINCEKYYNFIKTYLH